MSEDTRKNANSTGKSRGLRKESSEAADWRLADGELLRDIIHLAASTGGALRFGYSRDGGAMSIGIYGDGDPYTEWVKPSEDLNEKLRDVQFLFETIWQEQVSAASAKKKGK